MASTLFNSLATILPSKENLSLWVSCGRVYSVATELNMTYSGVDNPLFLLRNPSGSNKIGWIYRVSVNVEVTNVLGAFRMFSNPTVSNYGASQLPVNMYVGSSRTSSMLTTTLPTVSSPGTKLISIDVSQNNSNASNLITEDFSIAIAPGHSILLTGNPGSNNRLSSLTFMWAEL